MTPRLVSTGSILVDVVVDVPHLPERGGDVLAAGPRSAPGGGFNVVAAAARQGLGCRWVGRHGRGSYGDLVRAALADEAIEVALDRSTDDTDDTDDTGVCFVLLEPDGERTFVTCAGVDAELSAADLAGQSVDADDLVYVSGYDLAYPVSGPPLSAWVAALSPGPRVVLDPGPLVGEIPAERLAPVLARTDLLTVNAREAAWLTGVPEGSAPTATTFAALRATLSDHALICVRRGAAGCTISGPGGEPVDRPAYDVRAIDATGAGDAHTGVLIAGLAQGLDPVAAARRANAAAALAVMRPGPATAPTRLELDAFLASVAQGAQAGSARE